MQSAPRPPAGSPAIFNFETYPIDVYQGDDGGPLFIGRQVCEAVGLHPDRALSRLDDDEKGLRNTEALGENQGATGPGAPALRLTQSRSVIVINEAGLYSLILRSRKPETKRFRRWVTHEVLPTIRRTGAYIAAPTREVPVDDLRKLREGRLAMREDRLAKQSTYRAMLRLAEHARDAGDASDAAILTIEVRAAEFVTGMDLSILLPTAPVGADNAPWMTPTQIAMALGVTAHRVGLTISALGYRKDKSRAMAVLDKSRSSAKTVTAFKYRPDVLEAVRRKLVADGHLPTDAGAP